MTPADHAELRILARALLRERTRELAMCAGKFAYASRGDALKAIRGQMKRVVEPYRCLCGSWHIGTPDRDVARAKRRLRERAVAE